RSPRGSMANVSLKQCATFDDFLAEVTNAGTIRLVKLEDYGFTAPVTKEGSVFIVPMVRLVATAVDKGHKTVFRWEATAEARQAAARSASTAQAPRPAEGEAPPNKEHVRRRLQLDGFSVEPGEWTTAEVATLLGLTGT
ncbi:MAG TPA: hypothetical protein VFS00_24560, partial [Polyangiaceae bacterium]|nr:hypothetical protein [Polyangiaceae bacterium]